jgi:uncharacterized protein (DUF4415 family)
LKTNGSKTKRSIPKRATGTDWAKLRRLNLGQIRKGIATDPEAHATDEEFWKSAKVVMPTPKEIVTMRLDADLLRWFRQQRGYQTRINAILRSYMQAHQSP